MNPYEKLSDDTLEAYVEVAAALHGLTIEPGWKTPVLANMRALGAAAGLLFAERLDDHVEAAPIFTP